VQYPGHGKDELGNFRIETGAVLGGHLVAALHGAHGRGEGAAAGVLVGLPRLQQGLVTHHAEATHFLHLAFGIGDDPVPGDQLGGHAAGVADGDVIGEGVALRFRIGLVGQVLGPDLDGNVVIGRFSHSGGIAHQFGSGCNGRGQTPAYWADDGDPAMVRDQG